MIRLGVVLMCGLLVGETAVAILSAHRSVDPVVWIVAAVWGGILGMSLQKWGPL